MSKARAELQRQVNDCRVRNEFLKGEVKNLKLENEILRNNVAELQQQLVECQKTKK